MRVSLGTCGLLKSKTPFGPLISLTAMQPPHDTVRVSIDTKLAGKIHPLISPLLPQISIERGGKESSVEVKFAQGKEA